MLDLVGMLHDPETLLCCIAERAFLKHLVGPVFHLWQDRSWEGWWGDCHMDALYLVVTHIVYEEDLSLGLASFSVTSSQACKFLDSGHRVVKGLWDSQGDFLPAGRRLQRTCSSAHSY